MYRLAKAPIVPAEHERQDRERHRQPVEDELDREVVVLRDDDPVAQLDRRRAACPSTSIERQDADAPPAGRRRSPRWTSAVVVASLERPVEQRRRARAAIVSSERARRRRRRPEDRDQSHLHRSSSMSLISRPRCRPPRPSAPISANSRWSRQPRYQSTDEAARGRTVGLRLVGLELAVLEDAGSRASSGSSTASWTQPLRQSRPMPGFRSMIREHRLGRRLDDEQRGGPARGSRPSARAARSAGRWPRRPSPQQRRDVVRQLRPAARSRSLSTWEK